MPAVFVGILARRKHRDLQDLELPIGSFSASHLAERRISNPGILRFIAANGLCVPGKQ